VSAKQRWTIAIVGLLVANVIATVALIGFATHEPSRIVPTYEAK
jgi:hypothetical protein